MWSSVLLAALVLLVSGGSTRSTQAQAVTNLKPSSAATAPSLNGAWQAERDKSTRLFVFDAAGTYRELMTLGPIRMYATGRWERRGATLRLIQDTNFNLALCGGRAVVVEELEELELESLEAGTVMLDGVKYARVPDSEAQARFPKLEPPAKAADEHEKLARAIQQLEAKRPKLTTAMLMEGLGYNDALTAARRRAAMLDAPDLLRRTMALALLGGFTSNACTLFDEALQVTASCNSLRALPVLLEAGLAGCGMVTEEALRMARERGHDAVVKMIESKRPAHPKPAK